MRNKQNDNQGNGTGKYAFSFLDFLKLTAFSHLVINVLYFVLYFAVVHSDLSFSERFAGGGPVTVSFAVVSILVAAVFSYLFLFFRSKPLKSGVFGFLYRSAIRFSIWFYVFFAINRIYLGLADLPKPDPNLPSSAFTVPDTGSVFLNGTSFRLLFAIVLFSAIGTAAALFLRSETLPTALKYVLHGGVLYSGAVAINLLVLDGFGSASAFVLFTVISAIAESVFALIHFYADKENKGKKPIDYESIFD